MMKKAVIGSLILSILHSILFYGQDLGISVVLFAIPSVFLLITMLQKYGKVKNTKAFYLSIPIILLSSTYFIFDNEFFYGVNLILIPVLLGIMISWAITDVFKVKLLFEKSINLVLGSLEFIPDSIKLIKENFKIKKKDSKDNKLKLIGIGILCSIPIILILLALLISADGIFASMFGVISDKILELFTSEAIISLIFRVVLILIVFIYLVCIIYNITNEKGEYSDIETQNYKTKLNIDGTIINTILTVINIIYFLFSVVQLIYVFSYFTGTTQFESKYNISTYARHGFFQLMIVSFINFVIIIITNSNKKQMNDATKKYTKIMNVIMATFTLIIAISAFMRMNLYEKEFGYTFLRLMVDVILLTEMIMIVPTILYIVKGKINLFKSYFIIALTMFVITNFANIDVIIAKNNINRYINSAGDKKDEIDTVYLVKNTGIDAIPELVNLYDKIEDKTAKRRLNNYLYDTYEDLRENRTWQEFNISKNRAQKALENMNLKYLDYNMNSNI